MKVKLYSSEPAQWRNAKTFSNFLSCEKIDCKVSDKCDFCIFKTSEGYTHHSMSINKLDSEGYLINNKGD